MNKVLFLGRKHVAAKALSWLYKRADVLIAGVVTDSHLEVSPTTDFAEKHGLKIYTLKEAEHSVMSRAIDMDLALSVLYWKKIRTPIIESVKKGVINFHPAPLPDYKGTGGYNLAILEGHTKWAITAHYIDNGFDTGDIIDLSWFDIDSLHDTSKSLEEKAQVEIFEHFKIITDRALTSKFRLKTSPNTGGRYVNRAEMEAMKEVRQGDNVERKIRAFWFPPYDGAFVYINGLKCTLVHRPILDSLAEPGVSSIFYK